MEKEDIINTFRRENEKGDELDKKIELSALEYGHMAFTFMIFILGFINIGIKNKQFISDDVFSLFFAFNFGRRYFIYRKSGKKRYLALSLFSLSVSIFFMYSYVRF